ncbi:MAG: hypothetical protein JNK82_06410 [Myxococcaceae bacterium]|nr:hypothetical protein [Myxococcaceae bacterium]
MRIELPLLCCLLVSSVGAAQGSAADKAKAKTEYQRAQKAYDLGNFKEALAGYSEAYRLDARPAFLFNIGQCHRMLGEHDRAVFFFDRFLSFYPPGKAPQDRLAHDLLAEEEAKLKVEKATTAVVPPPAETPAVAPPPPGLEPAPFPTGTPPPAPPLVSPSPPEQVERSEGGLTSKWWFWTAVGIVAAGAVTTVAVVASKPQPRQTTLPPGDFR